jgi:hypothetical protein
MKKRLETTIILKEGKRPGLRKKRQEGSMRRGGETAGYHMKFFVLRIA